MTIQSTDRKAGPFLSGTALPFEFKVFSKEDIAVIYTNAEGVELVLVLDSDYSVTLNADQDNNPGGTATLPTPIVSGDRANIIGDLGYDQGTDIRNQGGFEPEIIEDALDRATIQIQQLKEITDRTLKTAPGDSRTGDELLADIFEAEGNAAASAAAAEASANRVDLGALDRAVTDAEAAEFGAQTAQGLSENARDAAQLAEANAEQHEINAEVAEFNAEAAQALAESAASNAVVNANVYLDIATGRAAVADGAQFAVVTGDEIVRYRRDTSTTQTELARFPSSTRVYNVYLKEQDTLANETYDEKFAFFNTTTQTVRNLTDGAAATRTVTKVAAGLQIALSTGSRTFAFSTANKLGASGKSRVRYHGELTAGTTGQMGVGFYDGANTTLLMYQDSAGFISLTNTGGGGGLLVSGLTPIGVGVVVDMELIVDIVAKTMVARVSINGAAPYQFFIENIAIGAIELGMRNASTVVHSLKLEAISEFDQNALDLAGAPEITNIDRNTLNGAIGLLRTMQRIEPAGWTASIPNAYQFYQNAGSYFSGIDLRPILSEDDPDVMTLYVDVTAGSNTNPGTSALPLKSLSVAAARVAGNSNAIIKAKGGLYSYSDAFGVGGASIGGRVVQIESWDGNPVISSKHDIGLSWTLDTDATYFATFTAGIATVFDAGILTTEGDYSALNLAASLVACKATPGTYFITGTTIYVHLADNRAPDANLRVYKKALSGTGDDYNVRRVNDGGILYMENIHIEGGSQPFSTRAGVNTHVITVYAKNCTAKYGAENGTNVGSAGLQVWQNCVAAWNGDDGFNWKPSPFGGVGCLAIEIDCIGRWNGRDSEGTNNGSTQHGGDVIRVNGLYENNQNRNVHDIQQGTQAGLSWNMGCTARNSQGPANRVNFAIGLSGETEISKMWLDGCVSSGSTTDVQANGPAQAFTFNLTSGGVFSGSVTSYTP